VLDEAIMKVLLLSQYYAPEVGAPQTRLAAVVRELCKFGDSVEVVTAVPNYPTGAIFPDYRRTAMRTADEDGVRVRRVWMLPALGTGLRRLLSYFSFACTCVIGLARASKPDVIVIESPPLFVAVPGILYGKLRRIPIVLNIADLWPDAAVAVGAITPGRRLKVMLGLERWAYRKADLVSTVTDGVKAKLREKGVSDDKILFLVNGVDVETFRPDAGDRSILTELELPAGPFLVYAGTMGLAHGIDPLVDAMACLLADREMPYLLMIGGGSERSRLEERVRTDGLSNVVFRQAIPPDQLARLLPLAEVGIVTLADIPLNQATRPAKLLPLMASGIPCLFAGTGEGVAVLTDGNAGVAVHNETSSIVEALRTLHGDPELRAKMGDAGRLAAESSWSWRAHVGPWRSALVKLVEQRRR
jgi:colanic acid biosynthesis glycosyl transferase WcaI